MQIVLATVLTLLAVTAPAQAQAPGLIVTPPMTLTFGNGATFEAAVSTLSRLSGIEIEIGPSVPENVRREPLSPQSPLRMTNVTLEQAIDTLTRLKGLSFVIVNSKTIAIFKKA